MAANFRICPQCSTRNRLDKEFCVKCGEPLEGVKAGEATAAKKGSGFFVSDEGDEGQSPLVPLVLVMITLGVGVGAWRVVRTADAAAETTAPPPAPQVQPSVPPPAPTAMAPGVQEYTAGMAALRAGDYPTALRLLHEAVAAADRADYHLGLAEALEKSGSTNDGLVEYEAAAGRDTANARYTAEWAKALNRAGRYPDAIRAYQAALAIDGDNLSNLREVAALYVRANDLASARPYYEKVVQQQPDDLAAKQNLARALEATRDLEGAVKQYREVLTAMPSADLTRALLSDALMQQNRPDDALQVLNEGLQRDPNSAMMYRERGRIMDRLGRYGDAIAAYQNYVRLAPGANDVRVFSDRIEQLTAMGAQ